MATLTNQQTHQIDAVDAVISVFRAASFEPSPSQTSNPQLRMRLSDFEHAIAEQQHRFKIAKNKCTFQARRMLDLEMETGTGKTYTFTRTIYALSQAYGLKKFVVLVPTLAIKLGFASFVQNISTQQHFEEDFEQSLTLYQVQPNHSSKKGLTIPQPVENFVSASARGNGGIHVLLINAGMLNSLTFDKTFLWSSLDDDGIATPIQSIAATRPVVIIDEPHRFPVGKKTWQNIERLQPQITLRFGATFNEQYSNLVYELDEQKAFELGLVKGVEECRFETTKQGFAKLKLVNLLYSAMPRGLVSSNFDFSDNRTPLLSVRFHLYEREMREVIALSERDLSFAHPALKGLEIIGVNKKGIELSNGLFLPIGHSINPFDVSAFETLEDQMLHEVIAKHFDLERQLLTRSPRIKPFTLIFISNIDDYRDEKSEWFEEESLREKVERMLFSELRKRLETEQDPFYRDYLQQSLSYVSRLHGGYFARDNQSKDMRILQQRDEILNPKSKLLPLENLCRFIFCKWTLREGWDNPNVFQICKIRASGSLTAARQELGRGLRLPLDEHNERKNNRKFKLRYFIDCSEEIIPPLKLSKSQ